MAVRHFLTGVEPSREELLAILKRAAQLKADSSQGTSSLGGRSFALIFEKPSTRTRISMDTAVHELGGHPVTLRGDEMQLSRGESARDTALVLGRHVAGIGIRTFSDELIGELARWSEVPVINMLTDDHHPCQVMADLLTLQEAFAGRLSGDGGLDDLRLTYVGDGNNMARSLALIGAAVGLNVTVAAPDGFQLEAGIGDQFGKPASLTSDPKAAAANADALYADVWVSMGDEDSAERKLALEPYRIDDDLLDLAGPKAIALHCLPAHPGEEITADVLYGQRQRIWDQAENRRHAQKAIIEWVTRSGPFG